ncbi:SDR family NAD(P)-dependent oxidoreductase [Streptomyces sp. NBC_00259]|uniref:SDR family NAD(P)-dependent oxidoreductase n=1 Tax=Streptomyces sp. NBC_00259 TaxID=2903643 RepID=UPI002E2AB870|nr:SDR family NAD(P)-dependent oxidoreductase [Streptomyces sp. NBC_00259]
MAQQIADKTALVTGGGSSIGRASTLALAAEGLLVAVGNRTAETLEGTVRPIEAAGGSAHQLVANVTDESRIEQAVQAAPAETGRPDFDRNDDGYDGEFRLSQVYSPAMLAYAIAPNEHRVFHSNGRHRGRVGGERLPDLWLPGQGRHRRPAVDGPEKQK